MGFACLTERFCHILFWMVLNVEVLRYKNNNEKMSKLCGLRKSKNAKVLNSLNLNINLKQASLLGGC